MISVFITQGKNMKKLCIVIVFCMMLGVLSGCTSISESSQEKQSYSMKEKDAYIEKALKCWPQDLYDESKIMEFHYPQMDNNGRLFEFAQEYNEKSKSHINLHRVELRDGAWKEVEIPWEDKINQELKSKNVVIDNYCYTDKGLLYLSINEYSLYPRTYYDNTEKYYNDYYLVDQYWFRINENEQQIDCLSLPKLKAKDYYNSNKSENAKYVKSDQLLPNIVTFLKSGNLFVGSVDASKSGLYDPETCKKIAGELNISQISCCTEVVGGDDYFALGALNEGTGTVEICIYSQDGNLQYTLPTEVEYEADKLYSGIYPGICLGTSDSTILLATEEGIYSAEVGDKQFQMVVDAQRDNTYYLSSNFELCNESVILCGNDEDYYLAVKKEKDYGMDETYLCHYTKK